MPSIHMCDFPQQNILHLSYLLSPDSQFRVVPSHVLIVDSIGWSFVMPEHFKILNETIFFSFKRKNITIRFNLFLQNEIVSQSIAFFLPFMSTINKWKMLLESHLKSGGLYLAANSALSIIQGITIRRGCRINELKLSNKLSCVLLKDVRLREREIYVEQCLLNSIFCLRLSLETHRV